ncbi:TadE/TadG family type IV pilus assembly protein [Paractinoplanes rishiriensis]|uniref:TadE/TadG family type IV pilus assembly protein n=1 Tax=Paractinoplanes rishiriensis TaxID=1050105 RepID=UPI00194488E1|nr:TadE family protein [Actinoplanes rishiriensis]
MEMAIVLPLLLLLVFGLIDFGRVMQQQILLTEAVREGARVGALNGTAADVQAQVAGTVGAGAALSYPAITVCTNSSTASADATVTAQRTFSAATPIFSVMQLFGGSSFTITLSATGVMACLG